MGKPPKCAYSECPEEGVEAHLEIPMATGVFQEKRKEGVTVHPPLSEGFYLIEWRHL